MRINGGLRGNEHGRDAEELQLLTVEGVGQEEAVDVGDGWSVLETSLYSSATSTSQSTLKLPILAVMSTFTLSM